MAMQFRPETTRLLADLQTLSGGSLTRSEDLVILLDLGAAPPGNPGLKELGFLAKFLTRTYGIMGRIGSSGQGYDALLKEFNENLARATALAQGLLDGALPGVRERFRSTYFSMTQDGLENLLALLHDLSWYKNWLLDHDRTVP